MEILNSKSIDILTFLEKNPNLYNLDKIYSLVPCNSFDLQYLEKRHLIKYWGFNPDGGYNDTVNIDLEGQTYLSTLRSHISVERVSAQNYKKSMLRANVAIVISIIAILVQALIQLLK